MQPFDSGPIIENVELENEDRNKRPGNQRTKRSSGFTVSLKNAKSQESKLLLVDMEIHDAYHKWFEIPSAAGRAKSYKIDICQTIKCTCEYFSQKNTRANISFIFTYLYSMCQKILIYSSKCILQEHFLYNDSSIL